MVSIKILTVAALLSVVAATHLGGLHKGILGGILGIGHKHGHRHRGYGRPLGCFGRFSKGIRGDTGLAAEIFLNLADRDYPANFDDALDVVLTGTRGGGLIIDVAIPNLGRLYRRMIMAASRLVLCVHNLLELPFRILQSVLTGRDDQYSPVCNYGYGKRWGWLSHQCDYSSTSSIIKEYDLWNARRQIDTYIHEYNGGDYESLSGSYRVIVEAMYELADLFEDSERAWSKDDFSLCLSNFFTITGAISNSYDGKLGFTVLDALYDYLGKTIEDKGFDISTHMSTIKGKMNHCKKQEFNGVFDTNSGNTINNDESRTNDDDSYDSDSSDSDNDASSSSSSDSSDTHSTNSEKNKKSQSGIDTSKSTKHSKFDHSKTSDELNKSEGSKSSETSNTSNSTEGSSDESNSNDESSDDSSNTEESQSFETSDKSDRSKNEETSEESKKTGHVTSGDKKSNESDDSQKQSSSSSNSSSNNSSAHKSSSSHNQSSQSSQSSSQQSKHSNAHSSSASSNESKNSGKNHSIQQFSDKNINEESEEEYY